MGNIITGAEMNHTIEGDTYTLEEIEFIRESEISGRELAAMFSVSVENIYYVRNRANSIEKLLKYRKRLRQVSDHPLEPPKGDPNKLCGGCARFCDWKYYRETGIYGRCEVTGEIMHRCDPCPCAGDYQKSEGHVVMVNGILARLRHK